MQIAVPESLTRRTSTQEWIARGLILLLLVSLRWIAFRSAGALWRDEVHSLDMATGTYDSWLYALTNDSFPALWQVTLRGWVAFFGAGDISARWLGFLIGLSVIPAIWWASKPFGVSFPYWSLVFLGLDPNLIIFGGEVRGYGLGVIALLILIGVAGRVGFAPTIQGWITLLFASLVAVHYSYTNCFMLAAVLTALAVGAVRHRLYRNAVVFMAIGLFAAGTMLPYVLWVMPRLAKVVHQSPSSFVDRFHVFMDAIEWGGTIRPIAWSLVTMTGIWVAVRKAFTKIDPENIDVDTDRATFLLSFAVLGTLGFWAYVQGLGVSTQQWYYLPLLTVLAVTADLTHSMWAMRRSEYPLRTAKIAAVVGLAIASQMCLTSTGPLVVFRMTAVDLVAEHLKEHAKKNDLVVVTPWYFGHSFNRYYHGPAEWIMLPNIDRRAFVAGYVEVHEKRLPLSTPESIKPELELIRQTLQSGGRIWWVGAISTLSPGQVPLTLTAAPDPVHGWSEKYYNESWWQLAMAEARSVGFEMKLVDVPRPSFINWPENTPLYVIEPTGKADTAIYHR